MTLNKYIFKLDNSLQKIKDYIYFPRDYFTPRFKHHNHKPILTKETYKGFYSFGTRGANIKARSSLSIILYSIFNG